MITCIAVSVLQSASELKFYSTVSFNLRYRNIYTVHGQVIIDKESNECIFLKPIVPLLPKLLIVSPRI